MKKVIQFLLLFVLSYVFAACSDDEYKDLQIPDTFIMMKPMQLGISVRMMRIGVNTSISISKKALPSKSMTIPPMFLSKK